MNSSNSYPINRRYGEMPVTLTNGEGDVLHGVQFSWFPVDEPPMIAVESVDRRWYREVWTRLGWVVSDG